jgi:hypothetical protein
MKKTFWGKVSAFLLCLLVSFSFSSVSVLAEQNGSISKYTYDGVNYQIKIVQDNQNIRIAQVYNGKNITTAELNKTTGETKIKENNRLVETFNINTNNNLTSIVITPNVNEGDGGGGATAIDSGMDINSNYAYTVFNTGLWSIKAPAGVKWPMETSSNSGNLNSFRSKVNDMTAKQLEIMASCGASALAIITASLAAAPTTLGASAVLALLTAAGCAVTAATYGVQLYFIQKDARYYYNLI